MSNQNYVLSKGEFNGELKDIIAKTTGEYVSVSHKGNATTLTKVLESIIEEISNFPTDATIDEKIATAINTLEEKIMGGEITETLNTFKDFANYVSEHQTVVDTLNAAITDKVNKVEGKGLSSEDFTTEFKTILGRLSVINAEDIANWNNKVDKIAGKELSTNDFTTAYKNQIDTNKNNITNLAASVNNKANISDVPQPSNALPKADGAATAGTSNEFARVDHVHPTDPKLLQLFSDSTKEFQPENTDFNTLIESGVYKFKAGVKTLNSPMINNNDHTGGMLVVYAYDTTYCEQIFYCYGLGDSQWANVVCVRNYHSLVSPYWSEWATVILVNIMYKSGGNFTGAVNCPTVEIPLATGAKAGFSVGDNAHGYIEIDSDEIYRHIGNNYLGWAFNHSENNDNIFFASNITGSLVVPFSMHYDNNNVFEMFPLNAASGSLGREKNKWTDLYVDNIHCTNPPWSSSSGGVGVAGTGYNSAIFGDYEYNVASGACSVAEGGETEAIGDSSHTEGFKSKATNSNAHAEGGATIASGSNSHAEGYSTEASGDNSHAGGQETKAAGQNQTAIGMYNVVSLVNTDKLIVGKGSTNSARANCFRATDTGVYASGNYNASGADYAEYFEWVDSNPYNEDRVGRFVTLEEDKIRLANGEDSFILGIISGEPSVIGDSYDDQWKGMYLSDIYGRPIWEDVEVPDEYINIPDKEDKTKTTQILVREAHIEHRQKLNPNYDSSQSYQKRSERPEWAAVGMLGKLVMIDDGTCIPNGYCSPSEDGIATFSSLETKFRVMKRLDENHIRVLILS